MPVGLTAGGEADHPDPIGADLEVSGVGADPSYRSVGVVPARLTLGQMQANQLSLVQASPADPITVSNKV
jgi:hypothetical protein